MSFFSIGHKVLTHWPEIVIQGPATSDGIISEMIRRKAFSTLRVKKLPNCWGMVKTGIDTKTIIPDENSEFYGIMHET